MAVIFFPVAVAYAGATLAGCRSLYEGKPKKYYYLWFVFHVALAMGLCWLIGKAICHDV